MKPNSSRTAPNCTVEWLPRSNNRDPESVDENAALIAEHREAAGDLRAAFDWHMRAADWSNHRDIAAARLAGDVHDRSPTASPR